MSTFLNTLLTQLNVLYSIISETGYSGSKQFFFFCKIQINTLKNPASTLLKSFRTFGLLGQRQMGHW